MYIRNRGRRRAHRMHDAFLAIDTDVRLGSEIVLVAFLGLMHLRIALLLAVLGRRRGGNDGRVHDGTGGDADALAFQIQVHRIQDLAIQLMLLKKMAEVENRGLVGRGAAAQIDSGKAPQHGRFVERILGAGIGEVEPVLQKSTRVNDTIVKRRDFLKLGGLALAQAEAARTGAAMYPGAAAADGKADYTLHFAPVTGGLD